MPRFILTRLVCADQNKVFDIMSNYEEFPRLLPEFFPSVRLRSRRDQVSVAEEHFRIAGKELVMMTKHVLHPPSRHEVFVLGGDAKGSHFVETFAPEDNGTKVTVDIDMKGMKLFGVLAKSKIKGDYDKLLDKFVQLAQN